MFYILPLSPRILSLLPGTLSTTSSRTPGHGGSENESIAVNRQGKVGTPDSDDASESVTVYDTFRSCLALMIPVSHAHVSLSGDLIRPGRSHDYPSPWRPQLEHISAADWCVSLSRMTVGSRCYAERDR